MHANPPIAEAVSAAHDIWTAFSAWLTILEDTLGGLEAGRDLRLADEPARQAATAAIEASPWRGELAPAMTAFGTASGFVETWTEVGEPPRGTGGAYLWMSVKDARTALEQLAGFLFERLREITTARQ